MPETPEMVEAVARAIYEDRNGAGCLPWARREASHKAPYRKDARAAIQAMREPTDAMMKAAWIEDADEVWRIIIDAALASPEEGREP